MPIENIPLYGLLKFLRWVPGRLVRWYYTPQRLAKLIYVDLRPRNDSAVVDFGQPAEFRLWLHAINLSPFVVELDRATVQLWIGGTTVQGAILKRQSIAPGQIADLLIRGQLSDGQATQIAKQYRNSMIGLDGHIDFNCKVRQFQRPIPLLDGINPKVYNEEQREPQRGLNPIG